MGVINPAVITMLDGLVIQQQAIANNIANINTPGYQPIRVDFANVLAALESGEMPEDIPVNRLTIKKEQPVSSLLNEEIALQAETLLRYQALIRGINKQLSLTQLAISEGKR